MTRTSLILSNILLCFRCAAWSIEAVQYLRLCIISSSKPCNVWLVALGIMANANPQEAVRVVVRCRPLNSKEKADGRDTIVTMDQKTGQVSLRNPAEGGAEPPKTSQTNTTSAQFVRDQPNLALSSLGCCSVHGKYHVETSRGNE